MHFVAIESKIANEKEIECKAIMTFDTSSLLLCQHSKLLNSSNINCRSKYLSPINTEQRKGEGEGKRERERK